jgi:hypothetical protein
MGLLGAAAVAGTSYAVGSRAARRNAQDEEQEQRLAELESEQYNRYTQPPPQPVTSHYSASDDTISQLKALAELKQAGILTHDEFEREKRKLLKT